MQAFRRQGRRYGAGLVCSEMVSCAGIEHRNERTLGYLRVAADEHPLAIQLFGSEPRTLANAAKMVEAVGADLVDLNFGCPVRKVTRTGAGATLLEDPALACRIVESVADAVDLPVTVKLRRGLRNGSRACLELGPELVDAGAASLTLHPRSAEQMYTGSADHSLTAELVSLVDVPVVASGDVTSRARAPGRAREHRRRSGDGRPRRPGKSVGAPGDRRRRCERTVSRRGGCRARPLRSRGRSRARGEAGLGVPQEVLRLVSRPRPLPEAVQAGDPAARLHRRGRAQAHRRGAGRTRAPRSGSRRRFRRETS